MNKIYSITVAPGRRWSSARVGGRDFSKHAPTELNEADMTDEIRESPLLVVEEVASGPEPEPEQKAKPKRAAKGAADDKDG